MATSPDISQRVAQLREQQKVALSALSQTRASVLRPGAAMSTSLPATPCCSTRATGASPNRSPVEDARHLSLQLAKRRVQEAQAQLHAAERRAASADPADVGEQGLVKLLAAARVRSVLFAQHEASVRTALLAWHAASFLARGGTGGPKARVLELVLVRLQSNTLAWVLHAWSRAVREIEREQARATRMSTVLHGKWALQRVFTVEQHTRERLTHSILRGWLHGELARSWRTWREACMMMQSKEAQ